MTLGVPILGDSGCLETQCCYTIRHRVYLLYGRKGVSHRNIGRSCWRGGFASGVQPLGLWHLRAWCWLARSSSDGQHPGDVVDELVLSYILAPLGSFDLWRPGSATETWSHASQWVGAVCVSKGLTALGIKTARECGRLCWHPQSRNCTLLCLRRFR